MKNVLQELMGTVMSDLPVEYRRFGVTVSENASVVDIIVGIRRLLNVDRDLGVMARFCIGDFYNQITRRKGLRKEVVEAITGEFGGKTYQLLRTYGWVAAKWQEADRTEERPWNWYVSNKPDQPEKEREHYATPIHLEKAERRPQGLVLHLATASGRKYIAHLSSEDIARLSHREELESEQAPIAKFFSYDALPRGNGTELLHESRTG